MKNSRKNTFKALVSDTGEKIKIYPGGKKARTLSENVHTKHKAMAV